MFKILNIFVVLFTLLISSAYADSHTTLIDNETVVLLHGIALTKSNMDSVEKALEDEGYKILNITYPSQKKGLNDIAIFLETDYLTKDFWDTTRKVHFVTHSMGGLVVRTYLEQYKNQIDINKLGRVVMMGPPNKGSEVADLIHKLPPYKWYYGPAGQELTTKQQALTQINPYYELGIIAGKKEWPYFVAAFVTPGQSDGRVTVENTKLNGMKDHIVLSATHTFMMKKSDTHKQIVYFLKNGEFNHEK